MDASWLFTLNRQWIWAQLGGGQAMFDTDASIRIKD